MYIHVTKKVTLSQEKQDIIFLISVMGRLFWDIGLGIFCQKIDEIRMYHLSF